MQQTLMTLAQQHDPRIVLIAACICALSSFTGISMAERAAQSQGRRKMVWVSLAAVAVGFGVWATHFVAMLSYDPGFLIGYEPFGTVMSLVIAIVFTGGGVMLCSIGRGLAGGVVVGFGIAAMHYTGMNAISVGGLPVWSWGVVAASVAVAAVASGAAFGLVKRRIVASGLLTLAICGLHFTGMAAVDLAACFAIVGAQAAAFWPWIGVGSLLGLSVALLARFIDERDDRRTRLEEARLTDLANGAVEALLTIRDGRIISCNTALGHLTGFGIGGSIGDLIAVGELDGLRKAGGMPIRAQIKHRDGTLIVVEAALRPVALQSGLHELIALRDLRPAIEIEAMNEDAMRRVMESETRMRLLIQSVTDYAIYMLDPQGHVANWNSGAERNKGYTAEEIVGQHFSRFFSAEDRAAGIPDRALEAALRDGKVESEGLRYRKDGSSFWASVVIEPIHDDEGRHLGFAKITHDDTAKRETAENLARIGRNLELALAHMGHGLALFDVDGTLVLTNDRLREILGSDALTQEELARDFAYAANMGDASVDDFITMQRRLWAARREAELVQDMLDGRTIRITHRPVPDGGWVSTYEDISERRRSEQQIVHMAQHDALTGLPNRASFSEHILWALDGASDARVAVLGIDLDRFKEINDHLGHSVGDDVLRIVAKRMGDVLQGDEFISRFGGDEFAAYVTYRSEAELHGFIKRLENAITGRMLIDGNDVSVGASIGVAIFPEDATTAEKLISNADMAMYRAKASLAENVCFYQAEMDEAARERRLLARDLWQAIEKEELHLNFQIQKSVSTGMTTGYEVLLRWNHSERGAISPADFIPIAEECGAILPIGEWVLRTACREAANWPDGIRIAVNLSPVQLGSPVLVDMLVDVLAETGLAPWRLELEVTESAIIGDKARALHMLRQIKDLGITIAIDDFGTGYSSLETLRAFPFDKIKLDRSFMREVETSKQAKAIIRAILALGRSLEVPVLAEGVETTAQLALLRTEGCDEAQGFLLGRPKALELLPELIIPGRVA